MKHKLKYILILIILLSTVNSEEIIIDMGEGSYSDSFHNTEPIFKIINGNTFNCIKIEVQGIDNNKNTKHIISIYKNKDLKERNQLSQSLTGKSFMWLNKRQLKEDLYLKIECAQNPCDYQLNLESSDVPTLYLNEQYTYYVTEENIKMEFLLVGNQTELNLETDKNYFVNLWVKGNKEISSELEGAELDKNLPFVHYYKLSYQQLTQEQYSIEITGQKGDLINIGLILFRQGADDVILPKIELINGLEFTGYLYNKQRIYIEKKDLKPLKNYYIFENKRMNYVNFGNYYGLDFYKSDKEEEIFYTIQYINNTKYENNGNNIYSPQLDGIYDFKTIEEETTIGIIPMKPNDDFNYLTYEVLPIEGEISVSIFNCNNYPLCNINDATQNSEIINGYKSFYISYNKNEYPKDISPISKNQKMLLITCKKGIMNTNYNNTFCSAYINIRTNNKEIKITDFIKENPPYYKFLNKDVEHKYFIGGNSNPIYLYLETISGEVNIDIKPKDNYKSEVIDNKKLYIIPENKDISVTIKGKENSVYTIYDNYNIISNNITIGSNYLFTIKEDSLSLQYSKENLDQSSETEDYNYLLGIYPLKCSINVERIQNEEIKNNKILTNDNDFYQEILSTSVSYTLNFKRVEQSTNPSESCLIYISMFKLENSNSYNIGIPLGNNSPQLFSFNKNNNYNMVFSHPLTKIENDLEFNFTLINEGNYNIKFLAQNVEIKNENINVNQIIKIEAKKIKTICKNNNSICKIVLLIESKNTEEEYNLQINDKNNAHKNEEGGHDKDDEDDDDNDKLIIILCISGISVLIVVGVILYIILKTFKKGKDLNKQVTQISFQESERNERNEDNDNIDTLLG